MPLGQLRRVSTTITGFSGAPFYNQLYFDAASISSAAAVAAAGSFWASASFYMRSLLTATTSGDVENLDATTGQITSMDSVSPIVNEGQVATGDALPPATQLLIRLGTGSWVQGRQLKGKIYVPGCSAAQNSGGVPNTSLRNNMGDAADVLAGKQLVVYSRTHRIWYPVTSTSVWEKWAVLRSRRD